jgi:2-polyprenyl-6-methoxyphenol hydroxylase-like FAD-dependent oxidoreductase
MTRPVALVIGAGVAGLSAAWWLQKIDWRVIVVERAADLRGGGYMMGLSGPGYGAAARMGLVPTLRAASYEIDENVYRDRRGREILRLRYRDFLQELPYLAIRRTDLVDALDRALGGDVERRFATTVAAISQGEDGAATAVLGDGSEIRADLVIGADGFRSATRRALFGPDETCLEPLGYRFAVYDVEDAAALEADFLSYAEPGHLAEYYSLHGSRLAAMHVWTSAESGPIVERDRWALLEKVAACSHPRVRELMRKAQDGPPPIVDDLTLVDLPQWSKGSAVLLGDAAHCLTLVSGQGAGMAMASAELLAQELARHRVREALAAHERRLRPDIVRLQQRSRHMAALFIPRSGLTFHLRNLVLRHMPRAWLGRYFVNAIRSELSLIETAT